MKLSLTMNGFVNKLLREYVLDKEVRSGGEKEGHLSASKTQMKCDDERRQTR